MSFTRRDFLNGMALTIGGALTPWQQLMAKQTTIYPPALTGLRGNHEGSNTIAHTLAFNEKTYNLQNIKIHEHYDLVIVGAGISGLSAAYLYREHFPKAKILLLDNHDDFGGHARRNEFHIDGHLLLSNAGSESLEAPSSFDPEVHHFLNKIGINYQKFYKYYDQELYPSLGMQAGVFLDKKNWGKSKIIAGDIFEDFAENIEDLPLSPKDKKALYNLYNSNQNHLPQLKDSEALKDYLQKISYEDYLCKIVGLSKEASLIFQGITIDEWSYPFDLYGAYDAYLNGYPGFMGLSWTDEEDEEEDDDEPYIFIYPDGNATIARQLVRSLIPQIAKGKTIEDLITAKFDYQQLDKENHLVKIRLNSTVIEVKNSKNGVELSYIKENKPYRISANKAILSCGHAIIPKICREVSTKQSEVLEKNVQGISLYGKVLVKNWQPFVKLGTDYIYAPTAPYNIMRLNYPVRLGEYDIPTNPEQAMIIHMVGTTVPYGTGLDLRSAYRMGRHILLNKSYEELEKELITQLQEFYALADQQPEILAITINRWAHGYSYERQHFWDNEETIDTQLNIANTPIGNIHIAGAVSSWKAYVQFAISEAQRAIREIISG